MATSSGGLLRSASRARLGKATMRGGRDPAGQPRPCGAVGTTWADDDGAKAWTTWRRKRELDIACAVRAAGVSKMVDHERSSRPRTAVGERKEHSVSWKALHLLQSRGVTLQVCNCLAYVDSGHRRSFVQGPHPWSAGGGGANGRRQGGTFGPRACANVRRRRSRHLSPPPLLTCRRSVTLYTAWLHCRTATMRSSAPPQRCGWTVRAPGVPRRSSTE